jgi:outer membrane protein assembly factor BamA
LNISIKISWLCALWLIVFSHSLSLAQEYAITDISISGNNKTKDVIILRELVFSVNDIIEEEALGKLIAESKSNLLLTGLFNIVNIAYTTNESDVYLRIDVQERWYLWVYPIFEFADRNFDTYFYNQEWNRVNYGLSFEKHNFRGRNELLHFKIRRGYKEQYSIYYYMPYLDLKKKHGLWFGLDFFRQKETAYEIENYLYNYLGADDHIFQYGFAQAGYQYRMSKNLWLKSRVSYQNLNISDILFNQNPEYLTGKLNTETYSVAFKLQYDKSDNIVYPINGVKTFFMLQYTGLLNNEAEQILNIKANLQFHKQYANRQYFSIESEMNYLDAGHGNIAFPLYSPLGFDQYLRGFDNFVFHPNLYAIIKTNIKYEIIPYTEKILPVISLPQFNEFHYRSFIYAFLDFGYVSGFGTAIGTGIGLDVVFYYDRVLSAYIAWNNLNKKIGIFVQYKTPLIKQF